MHLFQILEKHLRCYFLQIGLNNRSNPPIVQPYLIIFFRGSVPSHEDRSEPVRSWPPPKPGGYIPKTGKKAGIGRRICGGQIRQRSGPVSASSNRLGGAFPPSDRCRKGLRHGIDGYPRGWSRSRLVVLGSRCMWNENNLL
jgi:hypothetical protein